jgi:hypothetical protein
MWSFIAGAYLGFALGAFAKLGFKDWQFWAIVLPTIFLFAVAHNF